MAAPGTGLRVTVETQAPAAWDEYVGGHACGKAYHLAAPVQVGRRAFGLDTRFMTAYAGDRIVGVLPLVEQSSLLFGRFLVSVPFFTYGGILSDDDAVTQALVVQLRAHAAARRVEHTELRHSAPMPAIGVPERTDKVSMVLELPPTIAGLSKALGSKLRSQIKRAEREDPQVLWGHRELLEDFYRVFSVSMRDLGTPVYPRRFFEVVCDAFGDLLSVVVIRVQGVPLAAGILLRHGHSIEVPWAAALPEAKRGAINMRMYWEMLSRAVESGAHSFDFGRSTADSGTYRFKAQWGAVPQQLHWHYLLASGGEIPMLNHANAKYALATTMWKRLPLWCANALGPLIIRNLP
jgi:FemAB-related protein (PEP-CTERM system-associated)